MINLDEAIRSLNHAVKLLQEATEKPIPPKLDVLGELEMLATKLRRRGWDNLSALRTVIERMKDARLVAKAWLRIQGEVDGKCDCCDCSAALRILNDFGDGA